MGDRVEVEWLGVLSLSHWQTVGLGPPLGAPNSHCPGAVWYDTEGYS